MKFNYIYNLLNERLSDEEKDSAQFHKTMRSKTLQFGMFKEERTLYPLGKFSIDIEAPIEIRDKLKELGYTITDYKQGLAREHEETREDRVTKIGKILQRANVTKELEVFNNRLRVGSQNVLKTEDELCLLISHNPKDIAGMSTDKSWESCRNLRSGHYKQDCLDDIKEGHMVAYLIRKPKDLNNISDEEIDKAIARISIKRLISKSDSTHYMFVAEVKTYGNESIARHIYMREKLEELLKESNKQTYDISKAKYALKLPSKTQTDTFLYHGHIRMPLKDLQLNTLEEFMEYIDVPSNNYKVLKSGMVDVIGSSVYLDDMNLEIIPIKFNLIDGNFTCSNNNLSNMNNGPLNVTGIFQVTNNKNPNFTLSRTDTTAVLGCPTKVQAFFAYNSKLKSLKGCPLYCMSYFNVMNNDLTSLNFFPKFIGAKCSLGNNPGNFTENDLPLDLQRGPDFKFVE